MVDLTVIVLSTDAFWKGTFSDWIWRRKDLEQRVEVWGVGVPSHWSNVWESSLSILVEFDAWNSHETSVCRTQTAGRLRERSDQYRRLEQMTLILLALTLHPLLWFCQEPWIHSRLKPIHEEARHKTVKLLISSLNALVQSAGFSLKMQPRLLLLPISSQGLTTATVSSWVDLILLSNSSRKFKTLLQDSFSWHPATARQHVSWKSCTGFPFQNVLNIKSLVCVSVL